MKIFVSILLALLAVYITTPGVLAQDWETPPTAMEIINCQAYQDMAEDGDISIVFYWNLIADNYSDMSPASQTILFQLIDTDNTTVLSYSVPYVYAGFQTNGYGHGVSAFYLAASDNIAWGQPYYIRIVQSPVYYESPGTYYRTMSAADWSDAASQSESREEFKDYILQLCDLLSGVYTTLSFKASLENGLFLNGLGESYFRATVPGIQILCPELFATQVYDPEEWDNTSPYDLSLQETYSARLQGSEIKRGADRLGEHFGISGNCIIGKCLLSCCIGLGIYTSKKGWGMEPGMVGASILAVGGAVYMGNAVFTMVMIATLLAAIAIMFQFFHKKA